MGLLLAAMLLPVNASFAAEPGQWKGLGLNESSTSQAIEKLGNPQKDETSELRRTHFHFDFISALNEDSKHKPMRVLTYHLDDFKTASLVFDDDKLVAICLRPTGSNKIRGSELPTIYPNVRFTNTRYAGSSQHVMGADYDKRSSIILADVIMGRVVDLELISPKILGKKLNGSLE